VINAALFVIWALAVVLFDCFWRRIPNWLVIAGLVLACGLAASGYSPFHIVLKDSGCGLLAGLFALLPFYLIGVMGAADVKVFAALGAWCDVHALLGLWIVASVFAGIHALWLIVPVGIRAWRNVAAHAISVDGSNERVHHATFMVRGRRATPYAAMLAVSALASFTLHVLGAA
jgi:prepilin peptidase CpaA